MAAGTRLFSREPVTIKLSVRDINWILNGHCRTARRILFLTLVVRQVQGRKNTCEMTYHQMAKLIGVTDATVRNQARKMEENGILWISEAMHYFDKDRYQYDKCLFGMVYPIEFVVRYGDVQPYEYAGVVNERNIMDIYRDVVLHHVTDPELYLSSEIEELVKEEEQKNDNH